MDFCIVGVINIMKISRFVIFSLALLFSGCDVYTEKQSEAVSRNVYATNESISKARVDLAQFYSNETTRFIKPPKSPIKINSISNKDKSRVVVVPKQYGNDKVIVVGSSQYDELLKDSSIKKQLEQEVALKDKQIKFDNSELFKQKQMSDKMVKDLNAYQKEVLKLKLQMLWRDIVIISLLALIGVFIYIKVSTPALL